MSSQCSAAITGVRTEYVQSLAATRSFDHGGIAFQCPAIATALRCVDAGLVEEHKLVHVEGGLLELRRLAICYDVRSPASS